MSRQCLAQAIFNRDFGNYPPAIKAFTTVNKNKFADIIDEAAKECDKKLSLLLLESQSAYDLNLILQKRYRKTRVAKL